MRFSIFLFLFLATLLSTSHAGFNADNPIRMLRRQSRAAVSKDSEKINCQSFRVGVEANNLRDWDTIPSYCKSYIKTYLEKNQYGLDIEAVAAAAVDYAGIIFLDASDKDIWVFDVEETLISNLNYLASSDVQYGTNSIDESSYYEWLKNSTVVSLPAMRDLFSDVIEYGFGIVLLSGAPESFRQDLVDILGSAGYETGWSKLILKGEGDEEKSNAQFKSEKRKELEELEKYRIVGNVGDQWSDLSGENAGLRTFKVPNPVYYIP